ncbi:hypothetical protein BGZ65_012470 [Modicella reniformis]|uniref:BTB domain-containing protein n=1 Tax=Modicella reniformis TaxID=1440133 RepID=A0A9P6MJH7_9FUNG|nr:hypothetical protein BGZ65_012470 [Modicella reniformis]
MLDFRPERVPPAFKFIHCIPHNAPSGTGIKVLRIANHDGTRWSSTVKPLMKGGECRFKIEEKFLVDKDDPNKYAFVFSLSTSEKLPVAPVVSSGPCTPELKPSPFTLEVKPSPFTLEVKPSPFTLEVKPSPFILGPKPSPCKSVKEMFPDKYQDMLKLLSDSGSVNVAFVFTIHNCQRKVALWAHRRLLDKYPRFRELFNDQDNRPVLIPIRGISLTAFCVMLKCLYTEDLDLDVDPSQYSLYDIDHLQGETLDSTPSLAVPNKILEENKATQFFATWNVKYKVTWSDLFLAADRFEIADLRKQCLDKLVSSVDKNNAMEILFGIGTCFKEEIRNPIMKYISKHLSDVFSIQTHDPFKRFADHEGYHEVMLELLRMSCSRR